jgi:hypothetical protein
LLLKRSLGAQFQYVTKHMSHNRCWLWFSQFTGATSLKFYVLAERFTPSGGQREERGKKTA